MLIKTVISQLKTSPYHVYKDLLIRSLFTNEAHLAHLTQKLKIQPGNNGAAPARLYSDKPMISRIKDTSEEAKKLKEAEKKKRDFIPKITLEDTQGNILVVTMPEASTLAARRNLKLIFVRNDTKSGRKEYKMVSQADYLKESLKVDSGNEPRNKAIKKEKLSSISSKIGENDLIAKIKKMQQWIEKKHEVRVAILKESGDSSAAENIFKTIETEFKTKGRVLQKVVKEDTLRFVILPPKLTEQSSKDNKKKKGKETDESKEKETADSSAH